MDIIVQKGKGVFHFSGREAQAMLALKARGRKGLSHLDFQINFNGGYRLSAPICEFRKMGFFITDAWVEGLAGRKYKVYYLNDKIWVKVNKEQV